MVDYKKFTFKDEIAYLEKDGFYRLDWKGSTKECLRIVAGPKDDYILMFIRSNGQWIVRFAEKKFFKPGQIRRISTVLTWLNTVDYKGEDIVAGIADQQR